MSANRAPSADDILKAVQALQTKDGGAGFVKQATTVIGGIIAALCLWVGTTVSGLSTSVAKMSTNIDQLQSSISDLKAGQSQTVTSMGALQANQAKLEARMDGMEADQGRTKERIRILEGQKPLGPVNDPR